MKRIYISSLFRVDDSDHVEHREMGRLYVLDWDTKTFLKNPTEVNPGHTLYKPKSKFHGARGVTIHDGYIYVAGSYDMLSRYDLETFELVDTVTFPEFKGAHQIKSYRGAIYLVSCANDMRHKVVSKTIVETEDLSSIANIVDPYIKGEHEWGTGRLHFNSINWDDDGDEYHVYYAAHMVFNYTRKEIIYQGYPLNCPHDIAFHKDNILVNSTGDRTTVCINKHTKKAKVIYTTSDFNTVRYNSWGFTRALGVCDDTIFVGSVPTKLAALTYKDGEYVLMEIFEVSLAEDEAIYDIALNAVDFAGVVDGNC
ncbi:MAG TPA: hypothetical protein ENI23_05850 [bacterium]|nr:hypothetical protein [bacterium]